MLNRLFKPLVSPLKRAGRNALEARGFYLRQRNLLPFGIDFISDIKRLMPDVRCFFDVGAWHGDVSRKALTEFPDANVVAFDPVPEHFELLTRLSSERFRVYNLALGDRIGTQSLFCNEASRQSLVFRDAAAQTIQVSCTTVDAF